MRAKISRATSVNERMVADQKGRFGHRNFTLDVESFPVGYCEYIYKHVSGFCMFILRRNILKPTCNIY